MSFLITILQDEPGPRSGNATRHELLDILMIALTASICGCEGCVEFADFAEDREELFREFLSLENGLPSHDTFSRLFRRLDPEALASCFGRFLEALGEGGAGVVAIDGKTLRRSFDKAKGGAALRVVTAFAADAKLVIGRKAASEGGNEITAARALIDLLDLEGSLVTADAIHCNAETAQKVHRRDGADGERVQCRVVCGSAGARLFNPSSRRPKKSHPIQDAAPKEAAPAMFSRLASVQATRQAVYLPQVRAKASSPLRELPFCWSERSMHLTRSSCFDAMRSPVTSPATKGQFISDQAW